MNIVVESGRRRVEGDRTGERYSTENQLVPATGIPTAKH